MEQITIPQKHYDHLMALCQCVDTMFAHKKNYYDGGKTDKIELYSAMNQERMAKDFLKVIEHENYDIQGRFSKVCK